MGLHGLGFRVYYVLRYHPRDSIMGLLLGCSLWVVSDSDTTVGGGNSDSLCSYKPRAQTLVWCLSS